MTDKQRNLISKYLSEDRINKLEQMDFGVTSEFINMILNFRTFHPVVGELCLIPYLERKSTLDERKNIEEYINNNKNKLGLLGDEHASLYKVNYLPNGKKWYVIRQTWFKGMSESPSHKTVKISESGKEKFEGIYNALFDSGVYSVIGLVELYSNALQNQLETT